jgi:hypothetical protein
MKWESKNFVDLEYADDFSTLYENISKMNEFLEAF